MAVWIFELEGKDCSFSVLEHLVDGWEENWFREQNAATSVLCHVKGLHGLVSGNTKVAFSLVEREQSTRGLCLLPGQDGIQLSLGDVGVRHIPLPAITRTSLAYLAFFEIAWNKLVVWMSFSEHCHQSVCGDKFSFTLTRAKFHTLLFFNKKRK